MKRSNRSIIGMFLLALLAACSNPTDKTPKVVFERFVGNLGKSFETEVFDIAMERDTGAK